MNSQQLLAAAAKIEKAAKLRIRWAQASDDKTFSNVHLGVAQQLQDRADQVRSWAQFLAWNGMAEATHAMETATREFLAMAEGSER